VIRQPFSVGTIQPAAIPDALKDRLVQHLKHSELRSFTRGEPAKKVD
jgi:hypothetical protein